MHFQKRKGFCYILRTLAIFAVVIILISPIIKSLFIQLNEDYVEDFDSLVKIVEQSHPAFEIGKLPQNYEVQKEEIREMIADMNNHEDFPILVSRYLTLLNDSHTKLLQPLVDDYYFLEIKPYALTKDDQLYKFDESKQEFEDEILTIGGIAIESIYKTIDLYVPAENQVNRNYNHNLYVTNKEILKLSGGVIDEESLFGNNTYSTKVTFSKVDKPANEIVEKVLMFTDESLSKNEKSVEQISSKKLDDVYYVDLNVCLDNAKMEKEIKKLKDAIDSGFYKIIIDVRDNSGGNSEACRKLLNAMGIEIPVVGEYVRYSTLAHKTYGVYPLTGSEMIEADLSAAIPNPNIQLVVL